MKSSCESTAIISNITFYVQHYHIAKDSTVLSLLSMLVGVSHKVLFASLLAHLYLSLLCAALPQTFHDALGTNDFLY